LRYIDAFFEDEDVELHQATWEQVINCHLQHKREDFFHVLFSWPGSDWECCLGCSRDDKKYWEISLKFHECLVLQLGYPFCDTVMQMVKYAFQKFDGIFVVDGREHYVYLEYEKPKKVYYRIFQQYNLHHGILFGFTFYIKISMSQANHTLLNFRSNT